MNEIHCRARHFVKQQSKTTGVCVSQVGRVVTCCHAHRMTNARRKADATLPLRGHRFDCFYARCKQSAIDDSVRMTCGLRGQYALVYFI